MLKAMGWTLAAAFAVLVTFLRPDDATALVQTKFTFAVPTTYDTLDPHVSLDPARAAARINLYDNLVRWQDNPARLEPWLAESHTISADGLTYTFILRKGAQFHDGGEIKAADVVYSMERVLALKRGPAALFAAIIAPGASKATAEHTVEFSLIRPSANFLALLPELHVVNAALVKKNEVNNDWGQAWLAKNAAGSGSYRLARFDPAIGFFAVRFAAHWNPKWGAKPADEIEFRTIPDGDARVSGLIAGEFQGIAGTLSDEQVKTLKEAAPVRVLEADTPQVLYAYLNNTREPTSDANFRRAIASALDYDAVAKMALPGAVTRNPSLLPIGIAGTPKTVKGPVYSLDRARDLLTKLKEPAREIIIAAASDQPRTEVAAANLQSNLEKLGVKSRLVVEPLAALTAKQRDEKQAADVLFAWRGPVYLDPHNWLGEMFDCDLVGTTNLGGYCNREVEKLLQDALLTPDPEQRKKLYDRAAAIMTDEAAAVALYSARWRGAYARTVNGVRFTPIGEGQELRWVSLD